MRTRQLRPAKQVHVARVSAHEAHLDRSLGLVRPGDSQEARGQEHRFEEADPAQRTTIPIGGVGAK
jgi:hypothetical protein